MAGYQGPTPPGWHTWQTTEVIAGSLFCRKLIFGGDLGLFRGSWSASCITTAAERLSLALIGSPWPRFVGGRQRKHLFPFDFAEAPNDVDHDEDQDQKTQLGQS